MEDIPERLIQELENSSLISEVAEDLNRICREGVDLPDKKYELF